MAASSLGRCSLLAQSRIYARTYLSRCQRPWRIRMRSLPSNVNTSFSTSRWFSQDSFNEPTSGYRYAKSHEWVSTGDSNLTTIGISNYAQEKLGDVVFVELPKVGDELEKDGQLGVLESVKAAADIYAPVGGTVAEINSSLEDNPELLNKDPYKQGWLVKLKGVDQGEVNNLMSLEDYKKHLEEGEV